MRESEVLSPRASAVSFETARWAMLLTLFALEFVWTSVSVDTGRLFLGPLASELLSFAPLLANLFVATLAGVILFCAPNWQPNYLQRLRPHERWWSYLLAHLVVVVGFAWLTLALTRQDTSGSPALFWSWLVTGGLLVLTWSLALLSPVSWWQLAQRAGPIVGVSLALMFCAVLTGGAARLLWRPLGHVVLAMVHALVWPLGETTVVAETLSIGLNDFAVTIAPACSGFEGLTLVMAFVGGFLVLDRKNLRFPQAFLLLPIGLLAIWLANVARIAGLLVLGAFHSPEIALGAFHSQAGWIGFNLVALGVIAGANQFPFFSRRAEHDQAASESDALSNPALPYLAPFAAFLALALITNSVVSGPSVWYGARVLAAGMVLVWLRSAYRQMVWSASLAAVLLGAAAFAIWVVLVPDDTAASARIAQQMAELPPAWSWTILALRMLGYVLIAPVVEELAFRGYLTRRLISADFDQLPAGTFSWFALVVSSLLFGVAHGGYWLPAALAGGLYACAYYRRGSLGDAALAHATTNALIVIYVLLSGRWSAWG